MTGSINCELIAATFSFILFISIFGEYRNGSSSERGFLMCLGTQIAASLACAFKYLALESSSRAGIIIACTVYFACVMIPVMGWLMYSFSLIIEDEKMRHRAHIMQIVIYLAYLLFILLNVSHGYIFSVSASGEYMDGPLRRVPALLALIFCASDVLQVLYKWKSIASRNLRWVLLLLPFLMGMGMFVEVIGEDWVTILPTYAIMLFAAYMFIQNEHTQRVQEKNQQIIQSLVDAAQTDGMTKVYNRATTEKLICDIIAASTGKQCMLIIVDLDDLKHTNDSYGHSEGDRALISMAHIMKAHFRRTDVVGRLGGDEFCAFIFDVNSQEAMRESVADLSKKLSAFIEREGDTEHCSIGGAFGVCGIDSFDTLYRQADTALYHVKRNGKNGYAFYYSDMDDNPNQNSER